MSLPATRVAVQQLDPWFVAFGRAVGAALLAWAYLRFTGAPRPTRGPVAAAGGRRPRRRRRLPAVHLAGADHADLRARRGRHRRAARHDRRVRGAAGRRAPAAAVLGRQRRRAAGGARLPRPPAARSTVHCPWPTCSCSPRSCSAGWGTPRAARWPGSSAAPGRSAGRCCSRCRSPCRSRSSPPSPRRRTPDAVGWSAFGYLTVVSMFLGFFAWYAGLARGGIARVGQIQLAQPVLTLAWSALLLGEPVTAGLDRGGAGRAGLRRADPAHARAGPQTRSPGPSRAIRPLGGPVRRRGSCWRRSRRCRSSRSRRARRRTCRP